MEGESREGWWWMEVDCVARWRRARDRHPMSRNLSRGGDEEEKGTGGGMSGEIRRAGTREKVE